MATAAARDGSIMATMATTPTSLSNTATKLALHTQHDSEHARVREQCEIREGGEEKPFRHSWSVWSIFFVLSLFSFASALDGTTVTTALPTITRDIGSDDQLYLWVAQCFFFATTMPQPLCGQVANIFGRKNPFLVAIVLFMLGSGLSGGATGPTMLIAGRTIQGLGAAGLYVLSDIIICDIVPSRHRGPYIGVVLSSAGVGSTIGPILGGILVQANWRWVFYLNLPIAAFGLSVILVLLEVEYNRSPTWLHALKRVDFLGTLLFIPSMVAIFYALITGGVQQPWSSWRTLLPLILGVVGWLSFHIQQTIPSLCPSPSMPPHLFTNRTSATGVLLIFLSSSYFANYVIFPAIIFSSGQIRVPFTIRYLLYPIRVDDYTSGGFCGLVPL
jgi:MFS family permease